jgi:hypothetical protein
MKAFKLAAAAAAAALACVENAHECSKQCGFHPLRTQPGCQHQDGHERHLVQQQQQKQQQQLQGYIQMTEPMKDI